MARITVEDCLQQVPNRFSLVLVAAERTKQLLKGADPRTNEEVEFWRQRDPIERFRTFLLAEGHLDDEVEAAIASEADDMAAKVRAEIYDAPHGDPSEFFDHVYVDPGGFFEDQREQLRREIEALTDLA